MERQVALQLIINVRSLSRKRIFASSSLWPITRFFSSGGAHSSWAIFSDAHSTFCSVSGKYPHRVLLGNLDDTGNFRGILFTQIRSGFYNSEGMAKKAFRNLFHLRICGKSRKILPRATCLLYTRTFVSPFSSSIRPSTKKKKQKHKGSRLVAQSGKPNARGFSEARSLCQGVRIYSRFFMFYKNVGYSVISARKWARLQTRKSSSEPGWPQGQKTAVWRGSFFYRETPPTWPWWRLSGNIWG